MGPEKVEGTTMPPKQFDSEPCIRCTTNIQHIGNGDTTWDDAAGPERARFVRVSERFTPAGQSCAGGPTTAASRSTGSDSDASATCNRWPISISGHSGNQWDLVSEEQLTVRAGC